MAYSSIARAHAALSTKSSLSVSFTKCELLGSKLRSQPRRGLKIRLSQAVNSEEKDRIDPTSLQTLAEKAEKAASEAESAARRAQELREKLSKPSTTNTQDPALLKQQSQPKEDATLSELVDPSVLADEMGAVLSSLQRQRGQAS